MLTAQQRYSILSVLGLAPTDEAALWALLDTVQTKPGLEAVVIETLEGALLIKNQRLLLGTDEAGLTKAGKVEFDPALKCRSTSEVGSEYRSELARLVGWKYPEPSQEVAIWF